MTRRCFSQPWLADALVKSKAGLRRLYALVADASEPPDEVLLEQIALLRLDHDGAALALSRAKATVLPTVAIDAEMIGNFRTSSPMATSTPASHTCAP